MIARARLSETALALVGAIVAIWPLTTLLESGSWLWALMLLCAFVGLVGAAMRTTRASAGVVLIVQLVALLVIVALLNVHDHLDTTFASAVHDLVQEANETVRKSAVPAPVTPGLLMMLELIIPGLAIGIDFLAVTSRQPALAGVPMMIIYMLSTSNTGSALNPIFFILLAAAWLTMLAHGGGLLVRGWSSVRARALTPTVHEDQLGLGGLASAARTLGIATILLALIVPAVLPSAGPHYFADGLGRGGHGSGKGVVAFSTTVNLATDLRKTNGTPVLSFTTTDLSPPPLRVTAGGSYDNGEWHDFPKASGLVGMRNGKALPPAEGATKVDPQSVEQMQVTHNTMAAPNVPVPFPLQSGQFGQSEWGYSPTTQQPYVTKALTSYSLNYRVPQRDDYQPGEADPRKFTSTLTLDSKSEKRVRTLAAKIGGDNTLDKAVQIQDYLRSSAFTYSLTLAKTQTVDGKKLDPLSNFLVTKKGYCTQFATAMIMLARADGIPARMALGFLPGTPSVNDTYTVQQSNAHAWPELYLDGLGWTRFEPTPGTRSGAPPTYTTDTTGGGSAGHIPSAQSTVPKSSAAAPSSAAPSKAAPTTPKASSGTRHTDWFGDLLVILGVLVVALLGALVIPMLARRHRESISARLREHRPVEAEWQVLQTRLSDLGIPPPDSESSPRATERHYRSRAALPPAGLDALHVAMRTLEDERYAAPGSAAMTIDPQAREVINDVRRQQSWPQRIGSTIMPASGRAVFRRGVARVVQWPARVLGIRRRR